MKDLRIIPEGSCEVEFSVYGAAQDTDIHMLLQRIYTLLLTSTESSDGYRESAMVGLLDFLHGGNMPQDDDLTGTLSLACADILTKLDDEDRMLIDSLTCVCEDGVATFTLTLEDGTTVTGSIK